MVSSVSPQEEIWFLRVCHHISNAVYSTNCAEKKFSLHVQTFLFCLVLFCFVLFCYCLTKPRQSVISGFRCEEAEGCFLLGYCAASSGNLLPTFRDNLSVLSSGEPPPENGTDILSRNFDKKFPLNLTFMVPCIVIIS